MHMPPKWPTAGTTPHWAAAPPCSAPGSVLYSSREGCRCPSPPPSLSASWGAPPAGGWHVTMDRCLSPVAHSPVLVWLMVPLPHRWPTYFYVPKFFTEIQSAAPPSCLRGISGTVLKTICSSLRACFTFPTAGTARLVLASAQRNQGALRTMNNSPAEATVNPLKCKFSNQLLQGTDNGRLIAQWHRIISQMHVRTNATYRHTRICR